MDLFDEVAGNETEDETREGLRDGVLIAPPDDGDDELADWVNDLPPADPPSDAELEAQFCGQERAGLPSVSKSGLALRARWRAYLDAQPVELREGLERIEAEAYKAARRRIVLARGLDAEEIPESSDSF